MDKKNLNQLLDNVYELEGLLHLAIARDDCPEIIPSLIANKAHEVALLAKEAAETGSNEDNVEKDALNKEPEKVVPEPITVVPDHANVEEIPATIAPAPENPASDYAAAIPGPVRVVSTPGAATVGKDTVMKKSEPLPPVGVSATGPRGRLVFTINDRYRFKRDLFGGSDANFNTTLALVASMDSFEEAEDYFLNDLQFNPQRQETIDFLEIIKNYFKE